MLAAAGFHVFCAARRLDRIEALAAEIGGTSVGCDVTDPDSVAGLAAAVGDRLDVLVNNAGGAFGAAPVAEADADDWRRMFEVNVIGLMQVTKALLPALIASGDGVIVNVGSTAGRIAYEGGAGYTAAKHGTQVVSETLRLELWDQPVRVCEIAPGMVKTDEFALVRFDGDRERAEATYRGVPNPLTAEDVADAITWMVTRPSHVNVDELVIRPRAQAAQHKVFRVPVPDPGSSSAR
jgi:NADP-dependent 3-hydroxy acid dehydrogenase YdfG